VRGLEGRIAEFAREFGLQGFDATLLFLDLDIRQVDLVNDAYNAFAQQIKRFEVDFNVLDEDSVQLSRRDCKDATLNCCPYIMYR